MNSVSFADNVTVFGDDNTRVSSGDNTLLTGYKPSANCASDATVKSTAADANSSLQEMKLPFLVYDWMDKKLQNRVSVLVLLPSGDSVDKKVKARVSQDGSKLVVTLPMVPVLLSADKGLIPHVRVKNPEYDLAQGMHYMVIQNHPKVIAHGKAIAAMRQRNSSKEVLNYQRIRLPFKCHHHLADKKGDPYFWGKDAVKYSNDGSLVLHVELLRDMGDSYESDLDPLNAFDAPPEIVSVASSRMGNDDDTLSTQGMDGLEGQDGQDGTRAAKRQNQA
jgi:hypothetical protein